MSQTTNKPLPAFKGLKWYRSEHFSFFRPIDWHQFEWLDDKQGVLCGPSPHDNATLFAVYIKNLGIETNKEDMNDLMEGFLSGIQELPNSQIELQENWVAGAVTGLEAKYTFAENEVIRKRWVRVLYQDTRQITVIAQGATIEQFDYWLPMFYESMMTFKIHSGISKPDLDEVIGSGD